MNVVGVFGTGQGETQIPKKNAFLSLRERASHEAEAPIAIVYLQLRVSSGSVQFVVVIREF